MKHLQCCLILPFALCLIALSFLIDGQTDKRRPETGSQFDWSPARDKCRSDQTLVFGSLFLYSP